MQTETVIRRGFYSLSHTDDSLANLAELTIKNENFGLEADRLDPDDADGYILTLERVVPDTPQWWEWDRDALKWSPTPYTSTAITKAYVRVFAKTLNRDTLRDQLLDFIGAFNYDTTGAF